MARTAAHPFTQPGHRPGERRLHGEAYVFDADLLNQHTARERALTAPANLSALSYEELTALAISVGGVREAPTAQREALQAIPVTADMLATVERVTRAWTSRPEYRAVYGGDPDVLRHARAA